MRKYKERKQRMDDACLVNGYFPHSYSYDKRNKSYCISYIVMITVINCIIFPILYDNRNKLYYISYIVMIRIINYIIFPIFL